MTDETTKILVTGGAGYIGSHTCVALLQAGFTPVIVDNFSNSHPLVISRIETITGIRPETHKCDIADQNRMQQLLQSHQFAAAIHFAGLKAVGRSVTNPLETYQENISGSLSLLQSLKTGGITRLIFSSSATVYGDAKQMPISESAQINPTNAYGHSKAMIEQILHDLSKAEPEWGIGVLRYFNPVGAHQSGEIGEDPQGKPDNLFPYVSQVAVGRRERLQVFGNDYDTPDGTCIRDYIHVMDLAEGHVTALKNCLQSDGLFTVNLGTGKGNSVLEIIKTFEESTGRSVPFDIIERRPGDVGTSFADPSKAMELIGFKAKRDLTQMCQDVWNWQQRNPAGYSN